MDCDNLTRLIYLNVKCSVCAYYFVMWTSSDSALEMSDAGTTKKSHWHNSIAGCPYSSSAVAGWPLKPLHRRWSKRHGHIENHRYIHKTSSCFPPFSPFISLRLPLKYEIKSGKLTSPIPAERNYRKDNLNTQV